jgi:hypothetical protein
MQGRVRKLLVCAAAVAAAASVAAQRPLHRLSTEVRVVPPLADPALVPGVGRCTSDGRCTVTDEAGTRTATPLLAH